MPSVDFDRHCGVLIGTSGQQCVRGLNCKSHSMIARRAVVGRSLPFDTLLNMYMAKASKRMGEKPTSESDASRSVENVGNEFHVAKAKAEVVTEAIEFKPIVMKSWFFPARKQTYLGLKSILAFPLKIQKRAMLSKKSNSLSPSQSAFELNKQSGGLSLKRPSVQASVKDLSKKGRFMEDGNNGEDGKIISMPQIHL